MIKDTEEERNQINNYYTYVCRTAIYQTLEF